MPMNDDYNYWSASTRGIRQDDWADSTLRVLGGLATDLGVAFGGYKLGEYLDNRWLHPTATAIYDSYRDEGYSKAEARALATRQTRRLRAGITAAAGATARAAGRLVRPRPPMVKGTSRVSRAYRSRINARGPSLRRGGYRRFSRRPVFRRPVYRRRFYRRRRRYY